METTRYISEELEDEITDRYVLFLAGDRYDVSLRLKRNERKALEKMAHIHSFRMEHPELSVPFCVPKNNGRKNIKKGIADLRSAYRWGTNHFDPEKFDESFLGEVACRILPEICNGGVAEYRKDAQGTTIIGASTTPPYPEKLTDKEIPPCYMVSEERHTKFNPPGQFGSLFRKYRCISCHEVFGEGGELSTAPLDINGSQLKKDLLFNYLKKPYAVRINVIPRMPRFRMTDDEAMYMTDYISAVFV